MKYLALIAAILSEWIISHELLAGALGAYVSVLFAYHFFLVFLVGFTDWKGGFKLPEMRAAVVHGATLAGLLIFIAARQNLPWFGAIALFVPLFAFYEMELIFGKHARPQETAAGGPYSSSQVDYNEFLHYLKQPGRQFAKAGRPVQEEYGLWLAERGKKPATNAAGSAKAAEAAENPPAR